MTNDNAPSGGEPSGGQTGAAGYAGDIDPARTWSLLERDGAYLVDVRTAAEWTYVGLPDLDPAMHEPLLIEWQSMEGEVQPGFADALAAELQRRGATPATPLVFLCRSGVRSLAAARAMAASGWSAAYNIEGGFEGVPDGNGHRGNVNGWKAARLPWRQG